MTLTIMSFGGGVQSMACLVLAAQGKIDYQIFLFCNVGDDSEHPATLAYVHDIVSFRMGTGSCHQQRNCRAAWRAHLGRVVRRRRHDVSRVIACWLRCASRLFFCVQLIGNVKACQLLHKIKLPSARSYC